MARACLKCGHEPGRRRLLRAVRRVRPLGALGRPIQLAPPPVPPAPPGAPAQAPPESAPVAPPPPPQAAPPAHPGSPPPVEPAAAPLPEVAPPPATDGGAYEPLPPRVSMPSRRSRPNLTRSSSPFAGPRTTARPGRGHDDRRGGLDDGADRARPQPERHRRQLRPSCRRVAGGPRTILPRPCISFRAGHLGAASRRSASRCTVAAEGGAHVADPHRRRLESQQRAGRLCDRGSRDHAPSRARGEMRPERASGRRRAQYAIAVRNRANAPVDVQLAGSTRTTMKFSFQKPRHGGAWSPERLRDHGHPAEAGPWSDGRCIAGSISRRR